MAAQSIVTLMVEREEMLISSTGGKPISRKAHFLLPSLTPDDASPRILIPSVSTSDNNISPMVSFSGWRNSTKRWRNWVSQMSPLYQPLWERAGIHGAIMSSVSTIVPHEDIILELCKRWCSGTQSFIFPWGEATITLEDVAVIGGYSLGDQFVLQPLETTDLKDIQKRLIMERLDIQRTKAARACQKLWTCKFMGSGSDIEHEAFLSLWLSRFVFPGPANDTIRKVVFPIAIHLSRGTRIALAPAVLASLYRDIGLLKRRKSSRSSQVPNKITLWAPFQLVQVWIWERFESLRPPGHGTTHISEPRIAKWDHLRIFGPNIENLARLYDRSGKTFVWRPYTNPSYQGWMSELYGKKFLKVMSTYFQKDALTDFVRCVRTSELVGLEGNCIEQYLPHRVGMQFGFDQDIPVYQVARGNRSSIVGWKNYMRPIIDHIIYVPSRFSEPGVSSRYYTCWKRSIMIYFECQTPNRIQVGRKIEPTCDLASVPLPMIPKPAG